MGYCSRLTLSSSALLLQLPLHVRGIRLRTLDLGSTELLKEGLESSAERSIPFLQFTDQTPGRHSESPTQLRLVERANKGICERIGHSGGEAIDAAPVVGILSQAEAREGECVITNPAYPVYGLPGFVALDARPSMEDMVPAKPDEVGSVGLRDGLKLLGGAEKSTEEFKLIDSFSIPLAPNTPK